MDNLYCMVSLGTVPSLGTAAGIQAQRRTEKPWQELTEDEAVSVNEVMGDVPKPEPVLTKEQEKFVTIIEMGLDYPRCTVCNVRLLRDYKNKRFWCDAGHEQEEE